MKILKKITTVILSIIVFEGPQLHTVDAIKILSEIKFNISEEVEL